MSPGHTAGGPRTTGHVGLGQEVGQLGAVPVLGRAEEPVGGAELGRQAQAAADVLPRQGPGRLQNEDLLRPDTERVTHPIGLDIRGVGRTGGEGVVDGGGGDPP